MYVDPINTATGFPAYFDSAFYYYNEVRILKVLSNTLGVLKLPFIICTGIAPSV
jgi:hypothetical protein